MWLLPKGAGEKYVNNSLEWELPFAEHAMLTSEGHLSQLLDDPGAYLISPVLKQLVKSPYKKLDL